MLADLNEPLVLADGTKIDPTTGKVVKNKPSSALIEVPSGREAQEIVARTRRGVIDMPVPPQQMNALSLVCFYSMWGLADQDIAIQMSISIDQIKRIKQLPEYKKIHEDIFKGVLEAEATTIRGFMQQKALGAAQKIVTLAEEEDGALGLRAAQDILDRAGHRPADIVEHRHTMENSLQIEFIQKKDNSELIPVLDADFEEVNDGLS